MFETQVIVYDVCRSVLHVSVFLFVGLIWLCSIQIIFKGGLDSKEHYNSMGDTDLVCVSCSLFVVWIVLCYLFDTTKNNKPTDGERPNIREHGLLAERAACFGVVSYILWIGNRKQTNVFFGG